MYELLFLFNSMSRSVLENLDNLNTLGSELIQAYKEGSTVDDITDQAENLFISAYILGWKESYSEFDFTDQEEERYNSYLYEGSDMSDSVYKKFDGKDFRDRVREYVEGEDEEALQKVIETEYHRDYMAGSYYVGMQCMNQGDGEVYDTWNTMEDSRVRNTHIPLDRIELKHGEKFYTIDGDSAYYPGGFEKPANNINCRCWITMRRI